MTKASSPCSVALSPAVGFLHRPLSPRSMRAILWVAGLIALLVAIVGWVGPAEVYQAPWAWISFIGMCIVDDFLLGSREGASWGELPKIALLAAAIVFRRHPEITVLVAVVAAPLGSLLKGQSWMTQLTATAQWVVAGALVAVAGLFAGYLLGGRSSRVFAGGTPVPVRPLVAAGALLLISALLPSPLSWALPLGLAVVAGIWAVWRRVWPVACGALGAYCNEIVRAANGGRMPVDGHGVMAEVGSRANTYVLADAHTNFAWLDDRFHLPAPFPGIASTGDILIAIAMAWLVASLMLRSPAAAASEPVTDDATAPAAGAEAAA